MKLLISHQRWFSFLWWTVAVVIVLLYVVYENDPYDPYRGDQFFKDGTAVRYEIIRSKVIGSDLLISVETSRDVKGFVKYRRLSSDDEWVSADMVYRTVTVRGHASAVTEERLAVTLPFLDKMGGKYAYTVHLRLEDDEIVLQGAKGNPLVTRYRGSVPAWVLLPHILFIMLSMLFAVRAALAALSSEKNSQRLMWMTIVTLLLGGFVFGPLMQKYAFGVLWSGAPVGWDLTDNKVVLELLFWAVAAYFNTGKRKSGSWSARSIALAGIITILIYLVPHSLLGSAYDYTSGQGVGTGIQ